MLSTFGKVDADVDASIKPFLDMIAYTEGTAALGSNDGYDVIFGGTILPDWNENYDKPHPKVSIPIPRLNKSSDAFGRYQYLSTSWLSKTFDNQFVNKKNQDLRAQETILATYRKSAAQSCLSIAKSAIAGGNTDVNANSDFLTALDKLAPIWASLKTSQGASIYEGQVSEYSIQDFYNIYLEAVKLY
jgi:muramidase (phage lysozyme)